MLGTIFIVVSVVMLAILALCAVTAAGYVRKKMHKPPRSVWFRITSGVLVAALFAAVTAFTMENVIDYKADSSALEYLESGGSVNVTKERYTYFFDGPGEDTAVIFYPGALVQTEAYAPLMFMLAERGVDTFLVDMPLHIAPLGEHRADRIFGAHTYRRWYMAGHSLGGVAASDYSAVNGNDISGMIFLASYTVSDISHLGSACSIYGTCDKVFTVESYENSRGLFPANFTEHLIDGGNHAQFASYGAQSGDGEALISADEQKRITVDAILSYIEQDTGNLTTGGTE